MPDPADPTERKKIIISTGLFDVIVWHTSAAISVTVSVVLLWLNFTAYSIGGELGGGAEATANILGILQLAIKAHELTIVASLALIARQWIQGSLIDLDKGIPLALLGAEKELGKPSFLVSKGYRATVGYVVGLWRRKQGRLDLCLLTIFLFVATVVSSLAGPASGVLMIPRTDWFFDSVITPTGPPKFFYPYILVRARLEGDLGNYQDDLDPFNDRYILWAESGLQYWNDQAGLNTLFKPLPQTKSTHDLTSFVGSIRVNISTDLGRSLDNGNIGRTNATTILLHDILEKRTLMDNSYNTTMSQHTEAMLHWNERKYVVDGNSMTVEVNCHYRAKEQCPNIIATAGNQNTDWCPQNLVLLSQEVIMSQSNPDYRSFVSSVYMTEGPRTQNYREFTDSYQVIFDMGWKDMVNSNVAVCSILTTMQPAVLTSLAIMFKPEYAEYRGAEKKTILFHEQWLDNTNWLRYDSFVEGGEWLTNRSLPVPPRNMSELTGNVLLARFGDVLGLALFQIRDSPKHPATNTASEIETIVSGAFLSIYSSLLNSDSQYPNNTAQALPKSLMPELPSYPPEHHLNITIYNFGYGFRLSSRTGILGITILIAHAVIVVLGSLWQLFWSRSVISAWNTVPDYVALGLGSKIPAAEVLDNTCAGIAAAMTLKNIVKVGETTDQHLEIGVGEQVPIMRPVLGGTDVEYGSRRGGRKEKLE